MYSKEKIFRKRVQYHSLRLKVEKSFTAEYSATVCSCDEAVKEIRGIIQPRFQDYANEVFYCVGLNTKHQIVSVYEQTGGTDESKIYISELARMMLLSNAKAVILFHNHPGGTLKASSEDIKLTAKIKEALQLFNVHLLDHIICRHDGEYISLASEKKI